MEFSEVLNLIISSCPFLSGNEYDGIIIKKLAATNTISDTGASHQSHIAFTGKQKDFFPFLNADGYFNVGYESKDDDLKKYFTLQIPLTIYKENVDSLTNKLFNLIDYTSGKKVVKASVLRSRRNNADDQIELSIKSLDDKDFIEFRKLLRVDDFFVLLKKKNLLEYDLVGIRSTDKNAESLSKCTDFYKLPTQTPVGMENFKITEEEDSNHIDKIKSFSHNRIIFGAPGTGKSHQLQRDVEKCFSATIDYESFLKEEIKNRPQKSDKEPWFNHIGIKYANYVYKLSHEKTEPELQELWGVSQNELWKMKTAARACIDYKHSVLNICEDSAVFYERVTFHQNYSYAQFVGTYKPITKIVQGKEEIVYEYVPGPFIRIFIKAKKTGQNCLLLIEEINRANIAAVFGDVFQLLDRKSDGTGEYPITTSEDLRKFLAKPENLGGKPEDYETILIPSNMYIWATMNSADQGVFPMDTAFKRRWDFEYIGIDENAEKLVYEDGRPILIPIPSKNGKISKGGITYDLIEWNKFRTEINRKLSENTSVNEDKLLGPFFINLDKLRSAKDNPLDFIKCIKSKILMYLFEDVVKISPAKFFKNCGEHPKYSDICSKFDEIGAAIFGIPQESIMPAETANDEYV